MKYFIETYGCQMNVHDSERMAGLLEASGYERATDDADADLVVINTCSVREKAEEKLYTRLGAIKGVHRATGQAPLVAVAGCVAQQEGERLLERSPFIDVVVGTQRVKMLPMLVEQAAARRHAQAGDVDLHALVDVSTPYDEPSFPLGLTRHADPVKAYVTIIEGCNDFCAFCVVPYTRGHERMRAKAEILDDVREAVGQGRREIHLLGQIVNHYQAPDDPSCDFAALLEAVNNVPGVRRIRFASPHPRHASTRLIAAVRDLPAVCKHLHLPVQSGSTSVLQRMRRRHTREDYLEPGRANSRGYPERAAINRYDRWVSWGDRGRVRRHAVADRNGPLPQHVLVQVPPNDPTLWRRRNCTTMCRREVKTRRIRGLQLLQRRIQLELHEAAVGQTVEVLVDARSRRRDWELSGRTTGNTVVNFPGRPEWVGELVPVAIRRAGPFSVWGEAVGHERLPSRASA